MKKVKKSKKTNKPDLGAIFDAHIRHEFVDHDVAATMKTCWPNRTSTTCPRSPAATVTPAWSIFTRTTSSARCPPIPASSGSRVRLASTKGWMNSFCISRTTAPLITCFLVFLPPGGELAVPHVVVMRFKGHKVACEHIYWDQACVLAQIGLLDPGKLPITGARQAEVLVEKSGRKRV